MNRQTILFDLDDTLIYCNRYFITAIERFAELMNKWFADHGFTLKDYKRTQLELDLVGVQTHGFVKERFPQSFVETYEFYSERTGRKKRQEEERQLYRLGLSVYEQNIEAYPHMEETLASLQRHGHELILYTGGDESVQRNKVKQAKLERFFGEKIYVAPHKTTDDLKRILVSERLRRATTWMIGNSERTDILPALTAGINAIHIPADKEWEFNRVKINVRPRGVFVKLNSLKEVPAIIAEYAEEAKAADSNC